MDIHEIIAPEGFMPIIPIWGLAVPSYTFFVFMGLTLGALVFKLAQRGCIGKSASDEAGFFRGFEGFAIAASALIGSAIGSKLPIILYYWREIWASESPLLSMISGRTILGGMLGGLMGVLLFKKLFGIRSRFGNQLAPAVALGMAVGRLGCFFQGCCVGSVSTLPWAIDFGDGLHRHPTQVYEIVLHLLLFVILWVHPERKREGGKLVVFYFGAYFIIRFFEEFIREVHERAFGLSLYQWLCMFGLTFILGKWQVSLLRARKVGGT